MLPRGSMWAIGLSVRRPAFLAVSSPNASATTPCDTSWRMMAGMSCARSSSRAARRSANAASLGMSETLPVVGSPGARVSLVVDPSQSLRRDPRVHLGRRDRGVPEQLLHGTDVRAVVEHVGGARVPEDVRREAGAEADPVAVAADHGPRALTAEAPTPRVEEDRLGVTATGPARRCQRVATRARQPRPEGHARGPTDGHDALLVTLAPGAQHAFVEGDVAERQAHELRDAQ